MGSRVQSKGFDRFGGMKAMWVLLTFDLPVLTKAQKRSYVQFTKRLKRAGFFRIQFSVYVRPCPSDEQAERHMKSIALDVPDEGEVRMLLITDLQFGRQRIMLGRNAVPAETPPPQLQLF